MSYLLILSNQFLTDFRFEKSPTIFLSVVLENYGEAANIAFPKFKGQNSSLAQLVRAFDC